MQANKMSRNQKRKQRLLARGAAIAGGQLKTFPQTPTARTVQVTGQSSYSTTQGNVSVIQNSRRRRNRNRRRRQRANRRISSGGPQGIIPYDIALQDPENSEGCKIPDIIAYPTGTFQLIIGVDFGPGAGDACAVQLYPIIGNGSTAFPVATMNGAATGSLATRTTYNWTPRAAISALYSLYRPVSAAMDVFYIGTAQLEGGEIVAGTTWISSVNSPPSTFAGYGALNNMEFFPVDNGVRVLWKPMDNSHLTFQDVTGPAGTAGNPIYPQCFVAIEGLNSGLANTACFHANICVNFEAIPNSSTANLVETSPSPYDPSALRRAFEWASTQGSSAIGTIESVLEVGSKVVNVGGMVYQALPQRVRRRISRGAASAISNMMTNQMHALRGNSIDPFAIVSSGKEEEEDEDSEFDVASKRFEELQLKETSTTLSPGLRLRSDFGSPKVTKKA